MNSKGFTYPKDQAGQKESKRENLSNEEFEEEEDESDMSNLTKEYRRYCKWLQESSINDEEELDHASETKNKSEKKNLKGLDYDIVDAMRHRRRHRPAFILRNNIIRENKKFKEKPKHRKMVKELIHPCDTIIIKLPPPQYPYYREPFYIPPYWYPPNRNPCYYWVPPTQVYV